MKSLRKRFAKHDEGERTKYDDKILEYVLANDVDKLRTALDKKKYSALNRADDRGRIPIFEACKLGLKDCVDVLATVDTETIPVDSDGRTPLHVAALTGHRDCVTTLIRRGWGVNQLDERQNTALHLAASYGQLDVLQTLIGYQADTEARDADQSTPLIVAAQHNQTEAAIALLKNSVSVNASNSKEKTALMYAAEYGNVELVQQLLSNGAQADKRDYQGNSARSLAQDKGHDDVLRLLGVETNGTKKSDSSAAIFATPRAGSKEKVATDADGLRRQLEQERRALAEAQSEIATLKAQLDVFREQDNGDTGDVEFGSDDEVDLEGERAPSPSKAHHKPAGEDKGQIQKLKQEVEQLRAALQAAQAESQALQTQVNASAAVPLGFVAEAEVQALKDEIAALRAEGGGSHAGSQQEVAAMQASLKEAHDKLQMYRFYLSLAAKGALPADVKEAVLETVGAANA